MTAYYVIYSHTQNAWYMSGKYWVKEKEYSTKQIPIAFSISVGDNVGGASSSVKEYANVVIDNTIDKVNPYSIMKFLTIKEAESYLLSGEVILYNSDEFVTIRKIYMR